MVSENDILLTPFHSILSQQLEMKLEFSDGSIGNEKELVGCLYNGQE